MSVARCVLLLSGSAWGAERRDVCVADCVLLA